MISDLLLLTVICGHSGQDLSDLDFVDDIVEFFFFLNNVLLIHLLMFTSFNLRSLLLGLSLCK